MTPTPATNDSALLHAILNLSTFHRELGQRWAPAPLLERLANDGATFKEFDKSRASSLVGASS